MGLRITQISARAGAMIGRIFDRPEQVRGRNWSDISAPHEYAKNIPSRRLEPSSDRAVPTGHRHQPRHHGTLDRISSGERLENMATQLPPAEGWYPDPTGKAGQKYWDGNKWHQDLAPAGSAAASPGQGAVVGYAGQPAAAGTHLYKNPVLYAIGGLFLPPLVLFLMGGNRTTCALMIGMWVLFWLTVWLYGLGAIFAFANYIWSVVACYQEAVKQNRERGLA